MKNQDSFPNGIVTESKEDSPFTTFQQTFSHQQTFINLPMSSHSQRPIIDDNKFLEFYRRAADLKQKYNISLAIPEFILVGIQSSGKSSCLAQFLQMSVSFIQPGTGTRQPVRYSLRYIKGTEPPKVWINDKQCEKVTDLPAQLQSIMKPLERENKFSAEFIQVRIETNRSPDMIVIDLPGLIIANSLEAQMDSVKGLITQFITKKNSSGEFDYIPLVVLKAQDPQTDPTFPLLDDLCSAGRKHWRYDSVFIVNQIDLFTHQFVNAEHVIKYFQLVEGFVQDGCVVACSMNPHGKVLTEVDFKTDEEIHEYLHNVPQLEVPVLDKMFQRYSQNAAPKIRHTLNKYRQQHCGIPVMRYMIQKKIRNIVHKIKPTITRMLEERRHFFQMELDKVRQSQDIANPNSLLRHISGLVEHIFETKKKFERCEALECAHGAVSQLNYLQTWKKEMEEFRVVNLSEDSKEWDSTYYIKPEKLEKILKSHPNGEHYIDLIKCPLRGMPQFKRAFILWRVMFSRMDFSEDSKTNEFVEQVSFHFDSKLSADFWKTVRNVLNFATKPLEHACEWLADYYKWRFKIDFKDIIHHVCHADQCPDFRIFSRDNFTPCIELIESGYGHCIDILAKDFISFSKYNRNDNTCIIDPHKIDTFTKTAQIFQNEDNDEEKNDDEEKNNKLDDSLFISMTSKSSKVFFEPENFSAAIIETSQKYFLLIRYFVLEGVKGKLFHRLLYHTIDNYKSLRNACITGVLDSPTKTHVDILSRCYQIEPQKLINILELESSSSRSNGFMIKPEELMEKCGFNAEELKEDVKNAQEKLAKFSKEEATINNLLRSMDNALIVLDQGISL